MLLFFSTLSFSCLSLLFCIFISFLSFSQFCACFFLLVLLYSFICHNLCSLPSFSLFNPPLSPHPTPHHTPKTPERERQFWITICTKNNTFDFLVCTHLIVGQCHRSVPEISSGLSSTKKRY